MDFLQPLRPDRSGHFTDHSQLRAKIIKAFVTRLGISTNVKHSSSDTEFPPSKSLSRN
jgi:hypothetical protein